jgi:ferrous iron transport protein A
MNLLDGIIGKEYTVINIEVEENISRRLQALGLTRGTKVKILNNKKSGSVIFKVRGTRLAIGKKIAEGILVVSTKESKIECNNLNNL